MIGSMTDKEIAEEIGRRLRAYRLRQNIGTVELAARAGLNRNTVANAEAGDNPRIETVVKILRALGSLNSVDAFLPPPGLSPLQLIKTAGKPRQRAHRASGG
jgi:putative transcriptional regulator